METIIFIVGIFAGAVLKIVFNKLFPADKDKLITKLRAELKLIDDACEEE